MPAATAAAEPDDEPPGVRSRSCGLRVGPGMEIGEFGRDRLADDHRAGGAQPRYGRAVAHRLAALEQRRAAFGLVIGGVEDVLDARPECRAADRSAWPLRRRSSSARACASASFGSRWAKARTLSSIAAIRSRQAPVYSSADNVAAGDPLGGLDRRQRGQVAIVPPSVRVELAAAARARCPGRCRPAPWS